MQQKDLKLNGKNGYLYPSYDVMLLHQNKFRLHIQTPTNPGAFLFFHLLYKNISRKDATKKKLRSWEDKKIGELGRKKLKS